MARPAKLYQVEGTILARRDHAEADRILVVLTEQGRMDLLAKGVRKPRSRKAGHLELFSRAKLLVSRVQSSWDIISQAEAVAVREGLQEDFQRGTYARYIAELVIRFVETEADPAVFALVDDTLARLELDPDPELLARWYEQQLLSLAGFQPEWRLCVGTRDDHSCRAPLQPRATDRAGYGVDPEIGGALCPTCFAGIAQSGSARRLSPSALSWLQALQQKERDALTQYTLPAHTRRELAQVMEHYIAYHLERRPAALRLLESTPYGFEAPLPIGPRIPR